MSEIPEEEISAEEEEALSQENKEPEEPESPDDAFPPTLTGFEEFWETWKELFDQYVWNNDLYVKLLLHVFIGQLFNKIYIRKGGIELDGRVSLLLVQDQGTGKNTPFIALEKVCKILNQEFKKFDMTKQMRVNRLDEFSDAATIGTVQRIMDADGKSKVDFVDGYFSEKKSDIITMREAKKILSSDKRDSPVLQYINLALESLFGNNVITKILINGEITCKSHASFILTTYPTRDISLETLSSGLFRRILTYYNPIDIWQKAANIQKGIDKLQRSSEEMAGADKHRISMEEALAAFAFALYEPYHEREKIAIEFGKSASLQMNQFILDYAQKCSSLPRETSALYMSFVSSYTDTALIIAAHRALLSSRFIISSEDMYYSLDVIGQVLNKLTDFISFVYDARLGFYAKRDLETEGDFNSVVVRYLTEQAEKQVSVTWTMLFTYLSQKATEDDLPFKGRKAITNNIKKMVSNKLIKKVGNFYTLPHDI